MIHYLSQLFIISPPYPNNLYQFFLSNTTLPTSHFNAKSTFLSNSAKEIQTLQEDHYQVA